jgi:glycosyltransferase involved in cell wall biosynthesis
MTIGLVMIVRNEANVLPRLADSVRDHIDYWTVVDTGSEDDTLEVLDRVFTPVEGTVIEHSFDGFGPSRTLALRTAEDHCDWMLVMDADETFHGDLGMVTITDEVDCIEAEQHNGDMRFWLPRLLRSHRGWESRGRAHEYYTSPVAHPPVRTDAFYIEHHGDGHDRPKKFDRDIPLLQADWDEEPNARTAFYLARSYDDLGDMPQAVEWYRRRLTLPGWIEETFYARYRLGACLLALGADTEAAGHLWLAWNDQPHRAEPLVALAAHYRSNERWQLAWAAACLARDHHEARGSLFEDQTMAWRIQYEMSIAGWYVGARKLSRIAQDYLLRGYLPEPYASSVAANQVFYASH